MKEIVRISKALADVTRIRMVKLLLEKDICACEMEEIFPISQSQVSRGLKMLAEAGFLKRWREGKCIVYVADRESSHPYCRGFLDLLAESFNDDEVVKRDREKVSQVIHAKIRQQKMNA